MLVNILSSTNDRVMKHYILGYLSSIVFKLTGRQF